MDIDQFVKKQMEDNDWYNFPEDSLRTALVEFVSEYETDKTLRLVAVVGEPVAWACPFHAGEVTVNGTPCMLVSANCVNDLGKERGLPLHYVTHSIPAAELATLREKAAMVDELRKDAERYRWLRDPSVYVGKVIDKVAGYEPMTELGTGGYPIYEYRAGPELDEAIDTAIAQGKGECTCATKDMPFGKCCKSGASGK